MDFLHSNGVLIIQHLQKNYKGYQDFLNFMSSVGDPRNIFSIYFPLWFQLSQMIGTKMIWVAVIGDWFNLIFKWILFGHRPYWWVQESQFYQNLSVPQLEQFPITCETGPGSPSGHAMGSSCVWYVMITAALSYLKPRKAKSLSPLYWLAWTILWIAFWIIQISVCISRVFVATHFPHQVVLGVLGGIIVAEAFEYVPFIHTASLRIYIKTNLFLFFFALGLYLVLKMIDIDLLWSVPKAVKWCANPDWIHIGTTPFAGLVRNLGAFFGLGIAINSEMFIQSCKGKNGYRTSFKLMCVAASLTTLLLYDFIKIPTHTEFLFYILSFCKSAAIPLTVIALIPYFIHLLLGQTGKKID
ncbi:glucose-6-phosphatase 2 isoform X1 [Latimeria chalumnae]|uniref:Glucose-6-phosphatase n=1 Tax=Latimeria chalumnae TaxID=7897 RepID=M3XL09_LATCH|nr:PREDICTED: glucose-6-phosphatase 2 [Latimeria chalumnae]|eukprot:XP_014347075.1 PREDICTED: glucose-6-phosphatase 2 [Latimeria chalumnae]